MTEQPTNADLKEAFEAHAKHDENFQRECRETDEHMKESLQLIMNRLDPGHEDYINRTLEGRLENVEKKTELMYTLFQGLSFGGKAILYTSSIVAGIAIIIGSIVALIRYVK